MVLVQQELRLEPRDHAQLYVLCKPRDSASSACRHRDASPTMRNLTAIRRRDELNSHHVKLASVKMVTATYDATTSAS